ncbi:uncharacterized protein LACBIDRAFT_335774 [Laccaria bicolor S238N-H82]|uniref:Predicted protein n=1 Tax=Laccaria bicolor (strain S238N-H82 / ATCC MYA-4686) TaxID=486041 RepID=B0E3D0_LACBS|nr:uncharacterized protein LACBIDRAFT_335774 [Laccaria bicolor S238N-H82]EDQ98649.1 predicted protein [Laccaria bicolor S238N-H82]|eukprot:XP_001890696.1 predicted protein [Laccaria bicolor S238N-H82]
MTPVLVIHYFCPHIPSSSRHQWVPSLMASSSCHPNTGGWAMAPRGLGSKTGSDLNGEGMFMSFAMSNFAPFSFKWFCTQPFCGVLEVGVESGKGEREGEVEYTAESQSLCPDIPSVVGGVSKKYESGDALSGGRILSHRAPQTKTMQKSTCAFQSSPWLQVEDTSLGFERAYLGHTDVNSWITGAEVPGDDGNESMIQ